MEGSTFWGGKKEAGEEEVGSVSGEKEKKERKREIKERKGRKGTRRMRLMRMRKGGKVVSI